MVDMITSHLSFTRPYRESTTYAPVLLPIPLRIWYAYGVRGHIVRVVAVILGGAA